LFPASSFLVTELEFGNDSEIEVEVEVDFGADFEVAVDGSVGSRETVDLGSPGVSATAGSPGATTTAGVSKVVGACS
jgi:hypothetical protein